MPRKKKLSGYYHQMNKELTLYYYEPVYRAFDKSWHTFDFALLIEEKDFHLHYRIGDKNVIWITLEDAIVLDLKLQEMYENNESELEEYEDFLNQFILKKEKEHVV